jgi:hypothetical protein
MCELTFVEVREKWVILLILVMIMSAFSGTVWAQDAEPKGIVVWRLVANEGVIESDLNLISSYVTGQVAKYSGVNVIAEEDIKTILQGEQTRQQCGIEDNSCLVEIGAALGVPEAVSGSIGRLGSIWMLNLRRINVRTAEVISRSSRQAEGTIDALIDVIPGAVTELFGVALTDEPGTLAIVSHPPQAGVWIGEELVGTTPLRHRLSAGDYKIRLTLDKHQDQQRDITVLAGERRDLTVEMQKIPMNPYKVSAHATFWSGLGLVAVGGILNWQASVRYDDWQQTGSGSDKTASRAMMGAAIGGYSLGGALMVTGIVLWAIDPGDSEWAKRQQVTVDVQTDLEGHTTFVVAGNW